MTYYQYRFYCNTENTFVTTIRSSTEDPPTKCPNDTAHTVDTTSTTIIKTIANNLVTIENEIVKTNENYVTTTVDITCPANSTASKNVFWPFNISPKAIILQSGETHRDDTMSLVAGKDTIVAGLTANISPASSWTSQNYTSGTCVLYNDNIHGTRPYTCILNTVSNEVPTNKTYWKLGFEINVSDITYILPGYYINIFDGVNSNDVDKVVSVDKDNKKIYVNGNLTNSFSFTTPTYIRISVRIIDNYLFSEPGDHLLGYNSTKAASISADTLVTLIYTNNSNTDKKFVGQLEYYY